MLTPAASALLGEIDSTLDQGYEKLHVVILLGMAGEIMPCGCSDGVRGGLIKFAGLAKQVLAEKQPSAFVALGGNHFRTMKAEQYEPFAKYYNERLLYVDRAVEALGPSLKVLAGTERQFLASLPEMQVDDRLEATMTLPSGTVVRLQSATATTPAPAKAEAVAETHQPDWTILFQPGNSTAMPTTTGEVAAIRFGGEGLAGEPQGRTAILPPPEFGGRDLAHLTLYIPRSAARGAEGEGATPPSTERKAIRSIGEVRAYKSIIQRSGDKDSGLIDSIGKRWQALQADRPILYEYERMVVKLSTPDDPEQLELYFQFQNREAAQTHDLAAIAGGDEAVNTCAPCHAGVVEKFKANDPHYKALETLKAINKHTDRFCVTCHVTPRFQATKESQGFKLYAGVQCESCHINAAAHAARPTVIKPFAVSEAVCVTCHTATQHPTFNFKRHAGKVCCNAGKEQEGK